MSSDTSSSVNPATPRYIPVIDKAPPRPAPTLEYSWREYNADAQVLYIRDHIEANKQLSRLPESATVFGFDLEWKPTYRRGDGENPVALVQLANDKTIFLLQITRMKEFPEKLAQLLANPLVVKTGVAIQSDAKKIFADWKIPMANCVDLTLLVRTVDNARWAGKYNSSLGLARLIEAYEYRLLTKGATRSNWEANLSAVQIEYACNDAHAGFVLYQKLAALQAAMPVQPKAGWFTFNYASGHMKDEEGFPWQPQNPNYDPGPPPPPREPREGDEERAWKKSRNRDNRRGRAGRGVNILEGAREPTAIPPGTYPREFQQFRQRQQHPAPAMGLAISSAIPPGIYHAPGEHPQQTFAVFGGTVDMPVGGAPQSEWHDGWTTEYNRPGDHAPRDLPRDQSHGDHPREYVHDAAGWPTFIPRSPDNDKQNMPSTDRTSQVQEHSYYDKPYNRPRAPGYNNNQSRPVYNDRSSGVANSNNRPNGAAHGENTHAAWPNQQPRGGAPSHAVSGWGRAPPQGFRWRAQSSGRGRPSGRGAPRNTAPAK